MGPLDPPHEVRADPLCCSPAVVDLTFRLRLHRLWVPSGGGMEGTLLGLVNRRNEGGNVPFRLHALRIGTRVQAALHFVQVGIGIGR
jgi:hypothetical protein